MKPFFVCAVLLTMPVIAWVPSRFLTLCRNPWCLNIYPEWLDRLVYSLARPYLSLEMGEAAEQMEFLETWLVAVIILVIFSLLMMFLFRNKFSDEQLD